MATVYQISKDTLLDIAGERTRGITWAQLSRQYGIPAQSLHRAYTRKSREVYGSSSTPDDAPRFRPQAIA